MSLQENLNKFRKQQEKCQSTLSSIASSKQASARTSTPPKTANTNVQKLTPASTPSSMGVRPPVKFSNDTERLQIINSIRKAPTGAQIKRVIGLLLEVLLFCVIDCLVGC